MINISTFICHFNLNTLKKYPTPGDTKLYRYSALLVILIPFVVYIGALRLGFVYLDDDILIVDNYEKISHIENLGRAFRSDAFFANISPYYRPLMNVSFMVDAALGGPSPAIYHFGNVIYHMLTCLSLLWLLSLLGLSKPKALIGTLIFAVHPMIGHAVVWIPARGDIMVTLFGLLSFSLFILYLRDKRVHHLLLHVLCLAGAIFSKESSVFFPVLFVFWLILKKEKLINRKMLIIYGLWFMVLASWYGLRLISVDQRSDGQLGMTALRENLPFIPEVISRFFLPFVIPVTPVFSSFYTGAGFLAAIAIIIFLFINKTTGSLPLILLGTAWFIGFCFPNMFVRLVSAGDSFEYLLHRTYLPYVGFLIMLLAPCPEKWFALNVKPYNIVLIGLLLLLSIISFARQKMYKDAVSFWGSAIQYAPEKAWFHYYMGRYYFKQKDYVKYEHYLLIADSLKSYPDFKYHLGMVELVEKKNYAAAYSYFSEAFKKGYGGAEARENFVKLCIESSSDYFKKGLYAKAISRCEEALVNDPSNGVAAYNLGIYLVTVGEKQRAASMWKRAIRSKPDLTAAYRSLSLYYQYDVKKADSAAWYAREYNNHGGTGNLISPQ